MLLKVMKVIIISLILVSCTSKHGGVIERYQYSISHVLNSNCPCYPSCSEYCRIALNQYGMFKGGNYFAERLISEKDHYRRTKNLIHKEGQPRYYDPVP